MSNKRKNFPFLKEIPPHVLLKVVSKQTSKERIAMRKTCKYVNNFCEENRDALAKTFLEGGLSLLIVINEGKVHFFSSSRGGLRYLSKENPVDGDVEKKLSGLAIKQVNMCDYDELSFERILSDVKKMDLHAMTVTPCTNDPREQLALLEIIDVTEVYRCRCEDGLRDYLDVMKQASKVSKVSVSADGFDLELDPTLIEIMKNFHSFEIDLYDDDAFFDGFLSGVSKAHDCSLKSASFKFVNLRHVKLFDPAALPQMIILFDQNKIEEKYRRSEYDVIRILRGDELSIVLREDAYDPVIHLNFFDKDDEAGIFQFIVESLELQSIITEAMQGEYFSAADEKRFEILMNFFRNIFLEEEEFGEED